jgi:hypothetical protein
MYLLTSRPVCKRGRLGSRAVDARVIFSSDANSAAFPQVKQKLTTRHALRAATCRKM